MIGIVDWLGLMLVRGAVCCIVLAFVLAICVVTYESIRAFIIKRRGEHDGQ